MTDSMTIVKPRGSLKGWKFKIWLAGNAKSIKEFMKIMVPAIISWTATASPEMTVAATIVGKFVLDVADFAVKEKTA